jgi:hypothetical protein
VLLKQTKKGGYLNEGLNKKQQRVADLVSDGNRKIALHASSWASLKLAASIRLYPEMAFRSMSRMNLDDKNVGGRLVVCRSHKRRSRYG